ncbi:MAG: polysaccharide deacetylase family protein [Candidatus Acidiferrales bacterium]
MKHVTKIGVSLAFYCFAEASDKCLRMLGKPRPAISVVLHYHGVGLGERSRFAQQMDTLIRLATPISAGNRDPLQPGKRYAAVTFDDGFQNVVENAVPEMIIRKIPGTIFVVPSLLGGNPLWDTLGADYILKEPLISAAQLKALPAELITVGSHTVTHAWLPSVTESEARKEISMSRERLRSLLDKEIDLFSFPYGESNGQLIELCREAGYSRVFTIVPSLAFRDPHEFVTGRIGASPGDWPVEFRLKLLGAYRWLPSILKIKKRLLAFLSLDGNSRGVSGVNRDGPES